MSEDIYGKAFADMAKEPLDIDERQRLKELGRRYDTKAKRNARTRKRAGNMNEMLDRHGWLNDEGKPSRSALDTAFLNGVVAMPDNPAAETQ